MIDKPVRFICRLNPRGVITHDYKCNDCQKKSAYVVWYTDPTDHVVEHDDWDVYCLSCLNRHPEFVIAILAQEH